MKIYNSVAELIGNTPLLKLNTDTKANVFAKLECFNPAGSAKDRVSYSIIKDAEDKGILKKGSTIIEPTSGNTGIGIAAMGVSRGYRVIIVMPDTMSVERRKLMTAFGAELVLTDGALGMNGAIAKAEELQKETPESIIAGQFTNPANAMAHYKTTGPEIWDDTDGKVDVFVAGVGTGGTITGVGEYLKEKILMLKLLQLSLIQARCFQVRAQVLINYRALAQVLYLKSLTQALLIKLSRSAQMMLMKLHEILQKHKACLLGFRQVRHFLVH